MQIAIVTDMGEVFACVDDVEQYDLSKNMARGAIADSIAMEIARIFENEDTSAREGEGRIK